MATQPGVEVRQVADVLAELLASVESGELGGVLACVTAYLSP